MATQDVVHVDPNEQGVYEIESLCMKCGNEKGMTRILPIKIPHFKEVLLESFSCDECDSKNSTVKSAEQIQEKGTKYKFRIEKPEDFQRQVVRGDNGIVRIEDIELETPPASGQLTNLEGVFTKIITDLESDQPARKDAQPDMYNALQNIIDRLNDYVDGKTLPVNVTLDDPSGNSFIEPSMDDFKDTKYSRTDYIRSHDQNVKLGLVVDDEETNGVTDPIVDAMQDVDIVDGEVYEIPTTCPACEQPCTVNMKKTKIPHFKDVIIMATVCEHCGYKTNDIKTGGEVPEKGRRITLQVKRKEDLSRDLLKSETCALKSQALGLEVHAGTLGGRFTTIEGLLTAVRDQLHGQIFDMGGDLAGGDSMAAETKSRWTTFFDQLNKAVNAEIEYDLVFEDPLANSFVQSLDDEEDVQVSTEDYERTEEEMEELGLNDMKTEGYENDAADEQTNGHEEQTNDDQERTNGNDEKKEEKDLIEF